MKKIIASLALCMIMACTAVSCGDKANSDSKGDTEASGTSQSENSEAGNETEKNNSAESSGSESSSSDKENSSPDKKETSSAETSQGSESKSETSSSDSDDKSGNESSGETVETTTRQHHEYREDIDAKAFVGKWECEKLEVKDEVVTDYNGLPIAAMFQLQIDADNTAFIAAKIYVETNEEPPRFTWGVIDEKSIELVDEYDNAMLLTLEDGKLVGTEEGFDEKLYLGKVDEFTDIDYASMFE